jgi:hypothetical protein
MTLIYATYFPAESPKRIDATTYIAVSKPMTIAPKSSFPENLAAEQNMRFESVAKMAYGQHGKEPVMINQDIQPSLALADRMSYWLLAALMTFGLLGAVLLPVAALVMY